MRAGPLPAARRHPGRRHPRFRPAVGRRDPQHPAGGLARASSGYLAAISPTVHRLALELIDRQAVALASAVSDTTAVAPEVARLQGIALAGVYQIIISEAGRRTLEGQDQAEIADELYPMIENVLDELDRWLSVP